MVNGKAAEKNDLQCIAKAASNKSKGYGVEVQIKRISTNEFSIHAAMFGSMALLLAPTALSGVLQNISRLLKMISCRPSFKHKFNFF